MTLACLLQYVPLILFLLTDENALALPTRPRTRSNNFHAVRVESTGIATDKPAMVSGQAGVMLIF